MAEANGKVKAVPAQKQSRRPGLESQIVNTTSVTAYEGNANLIDYASTKGSIVAFTRSLAAGLDSRRKWRRAFCFWLRTMPPTCPARFSIRTAGKL